MSKKKFSKYAKITNLDIRPIVESDDTFNYFFRDKIFALKKLDLIRKKYIISKENEKLPKSEVILWIRNYEVSPEENLDGYKGNYGRIFLKKVEHSEENNHFEGKYTLCIEKIVCDAKGHPDRKIVKRKHPNWGHPILRSIKNKSNAIMYTSHYEAFIQLKKLYEDYPNISILTKNMLYIIVYTKEKGEAIISKNTPVQKIIIEIIEVSESHFKIEWRHNPVSGKLKRDKINMVTFSFFS